MSWFDRFVKWVSGAPDAPTNAAETPSSPNAGLKDLIEKGRAAQYDEDYELALQHFMHAAQLAEKQHDTTSLADLVLHQADTLVAMGREKDAEALLTALEERATRSNHRAPLAYTLLSMGVLAQARGEWDNARDYFEKGLDVAQTINTRGAQGRAKGHLADVYLNEDNLGYAARLLGEALSLIEESGDTELLPYFTARLGETLIALEQPQEGLKRLKQAYESAIEMNHRLYKRFLGVCLADSAFGEKQYALAYETYEHVMPLYPDPKPQTPAYARVLLNYAGAALHTGNAQRAAQIARQAMATGQHLALMDVIEAAQNLLEHAQDQVTDQATLPAAPQPTTPESGSATVASTDWHQVEQTAKQAIATAEEENDWQQLAHGYRQLASAYYGQSRLEEAVEAWSQALQRVRPRGDKMASADILTHMAQARFSLGHLLNARRPADDALMLLSSINDDSMRARALATAGAIYGEQGDVASADSFLQEALELAQKLHDATSETDWRTTYGRMLALTRRRDEGLQQLNQAQEQAANLGDNALRAGVAAALGDVYLASRAPTQAIAAYQDALSNTTSAIARAERQAGMATALVENGQLQAAEQLLPELEKTAHKYRLLGVLIQAMLVQAHLAHQQGNNDKALQKTNDALQYARQAQQYRLQVRALSLQSRIYAQNGQSEAAQEAWDEASKLIERYQMPQFSADWLPGAE